MSATSTSSSRARWFLYGAVVLALGGAVWYFAAPAARPHSRYTQPAWAGTGWPPPVPVRTVVAKLENLPRHLKAIGTVTPLNMVVVRSRVSGPVLHVDFHGGQRVERGQVLAEIDPAPYRIRLAQAEGQLQQNAARLQSARADLERFVDLHAKGLLTDQELETQQALVAQYQGTQVSDQAQVDDARMQLGWTRIQAPISGRTGLRQIDPGNLLVANDTTSLVVITQTRPIAVLFTIPEADLSDVVEPFRAGHQLEVQVWDRNETTRLATGVLKTIDNQIDTTTGTLRLKAEVPNDDDRLFPNEFVNVRMKVGTLDHAVVIPSAAVQFGSRGTYVYVVDAKNQAHVRDIVLGPADGDQQAVSRGLKPGDVVVIEGLDRLRNGRNVLIVHDSVGAGTAGKTASAAP